MYPRIFRVEDPKPIALDAYETLADSYAVLASSEPHNAYYERPAMLLLLGEIQGNRVLDAVCSPGIYAEFLVGKGAGVVAFDASERMVRLSTERLGGKAEVFRAYLGHPLASFEGCYFRYGRKRSGEWPRRGLAHSTLGVFQGLEARRAARLLRGASLVHVRRAHLQRRWRLLRDRLGGNGVEGIRGPSLDARIPTTAWCMIGPFIETGFVLERVLASRPTRCFRELDPEEYEKLSRMPGLLC